MTESNKAPGQPAADNPTTSLGRIVAEGIGGPLLAHSDDFAVDLFAGAMKGKLAACRAKGRSGWNDPSQCDDEDLLASLIMAMEKGDLVDVANFAMMAHLRGASHDQVAQALRVHVGMSKILVNADLLADVLSYSAAGAPVPAQTGIEPVRLSLFDASKDLLQWIETAHRPPKHDNFGIMALVRVDALATLADAVADEELRRAAPVAAGGANTSIAEEGLAAVGAEPVVAPDPFRVAARQAVMWQAAVDGFEQEAAALSYATKIASPMCSKFDRAAAAMAAESAQKLADAERSAAARASATIVSKLVVEVDATACLLRI